MLKNARLVWFVTLILGFGLSTFAFGWVSVPIVAGAWAWIRRSDATVPLLAALAVMAAWSAALLLPAVTGGAFVRVGILVGEAMQVSGKPLVALTLAFAGLLAGSAAGVVRGVGGKA